MKPKHLLSHIKIRKETLTFCDIEIEKDKFYGYINPIFLEDVGINFILVSNKISHGE